jgi:hypothetical protein
MVHSLHVGLDSKLGDIDILWYCRFLSLSPSLMSEVSCCLSEVL